MNETSLTNCFACLKEKAVLGSLGEKTKYDN